MLSRRNLVLGGLASGILAVVEPAAAHLTDQRSFKLDPRFEPQTVPYSGYEPGTIVVSTGSHYLYLMLGDMQARRYGIGVGRSGRSLKGTATVGRKAKWPNWRPTENMIRREPGKYARYANGVPGGPNNPLGARALYLYRNGRDTLYRIHGTNQPSSVGRSVSNGCIRMINAHVIDLYERVPVGANVVLL